MCGRFDLFSDLPRIARVASVFLRHRSTSSLQTSRLRMSVISHVQEIHERIPFHVPLELLGNGTSRARLISV